MSLSKGHAGSRFQIPLEGDGTSFVRELDHDVDLPGPISRRTMRTVAVVFGKTSSDVRSEACVVLRRGVSILEYVDVEFGHADDQSKLDATNSRGNTASLLKRRTEAATTVHISARGDNSCPPSLAT
jgi:hypothetical protein